MADDITQDTGQDAGGRAHSELDEPHPAGDGPRSDRETGGPTADPNASESGRAAHGTKASEFEPHE